MYYTHFGLAQPPFRITPDTGFFYSGGNRGPILETLMYAIGQGEGIIKVTGEVGSGKTMLCSMLQSRLPANVETVYLANPSVSPEEILHAIALELQLKAPRDASRLEVMQMLHSHLLERHAQGKQVVMFVEESQSMPISTLEEIRLLSNLETAHAKLLQIVLFGQPELDDNLRQPHIRQLRERITHSFRLNPLKPGEIRDYLNFRLRAAGYRGPDLFSPPVINAIAKATNGLTRRINLIADKALLAAFAGNTHTLTLEHVKAAVRDSEFSNDEPSRPRLKLWLAASLFALGAGLGIALYAWFQAYQGDNMPARAPAASALPSQPPAAKSAPAPTPAPIAAADSTDTLEARLAATQKWLSQQDKNTYSIQLFGSENPRQLTQHLNAIGKFVEINEIFVYRTIAKQKPSLTVLYGSFNDRRTALNALTRLPAPLKTYNPILRTVQGIRAEIARSRPS
jgi:type II secretory pathway predicted ATPase ExeA